MNTISKLLTCLGVSALGLFLVGGLLSVRPAASEPAAPEPVPFDLADDEQNICLQSNTPNLIQNPSFEGEYKGYVPAEPLDDCPFGVCQTAQVPTEGGWIPFWRSHNDKDPGYIIRQPEYKPACVGTDPCVFPNRLRDGKEAQQYFTFFSTHEAGLMQTVDVVPGKTYCLSGWGHSWSAQDDDDAISGPEDGQLFQKIGIDPTGGQNWQSGDIVWSDQENNPLGRIQYDEYGLFTVTAKAEAEKVTIFFYSQPSYAVKHNNVYWDDTHLSLLDDQPTTLLAKSPDIYLLTTVTETQQVTQTIAFSVTGGGIDLENYRWSAVISPTNSLTPTLNRTTGTVTDTLVISVSTAGLQTGHYAADLRLSTTPETANMPTRIPIRVVIVDKLYGSYLPIIERK